jgi:hypothetical protein
MKTRKLINHCFAAALAGLLGSVLSVGEATAPGLHAAPESTLWLDGDSTLHPFTSRATRLEVNATLDPGSAASLTPEIYNAVVQRSAVKALTVTIPVRELKSKESGLDKNMYKALKVDACPAIEFRLDKYRVGVSSPPLQATGTLRIACQEKPVTLDANLAPEPGGLRLQGEYALLMSEFGVKPPTLMLGAIKVRDRVVIHYDLHLKPD